MPVIRIQRIRTLKELDALEDTWKNLEASGSVFQSWTWSRAWYEKAVAGNGRSQLDVRLVEDSAGRPLAIIPLYEMPLGGPFARRTEFLAYRFTPCNNVLLADPANSDLIGQTVNALWQDPAGPRTILQLRHLDGEAPFTQHLINKGLAERQCARVWVQADPAITDQRMRLSRSRRKKLRRLEQNMRREMDVSFRSLSGADLTAAFDELIELHLRRFNAANRSSYLAGEGVAAYRTAVLALGENGQSEVLQLRANGRTAAAMLLIRDSQTYYSVQAGFDPDFAEYSPVWLLDIEAMRRGFDDLGCARYDLGPGYQAYKYSWNPVIGANYFACLGQGIYANALATIYRAAFHRNLPVSPPEGIELSDASAAVPSDP